MDGARLSLTFFLTFVSWTLIVFVTKGIDFAIESDFTVTPFTFHSLFFVKEGPEQKEEAGLAVDLSTNQQSV